MLVHPGPTCVGAREGLGAQACVVKKPNTTSHRPGEAMFTPARHHKTQEIDQCADIGRTDEARYGPVAVTTSAKCNSAHTGAYGFGCSLDVETTVGALDHCS